MKKQTKTLKDKFGRNIGGKLVKVTYSVTQPHNPQHVKDAKRYAHTMLAEEFFNDYGVGVFRIPRNYAVAVNSNFFGWQSFDLSVLNIDAYRPKGQQTTCDRPFAPNVNEYEISEAGHYDKEMSGTIFFQFIDTEKFLSGCHTVYTEYSEGVKRLVLKHFGFTHEATRFHKKVYRDEYGFTSEGYRTEVWAHPHGFIAYFKALNDLIMFQECEGVCEVPREVYDSLKCHISIMRYTKNGAFLNFQQIPKYIKEMLNDKVFIPHWKSADGFHGLYLWYYMELEDYKDEHHCFDSDFFEYFWKDVKEICSKSELLMNICIL